MCSPINVIDHLFLLALLYWKKSMTESSWKSRHSSSTYPYTIQSHKHCSYAVEKQMTGEESRRARLPFTECQTLQIQWKDIALKRERLTMQSSSPEFKEFSLLFSFIYRYAYSPANNTCNKNRKGMY